MAHPLYEARQHPDFPGQRLCMLARPSLPALFDQPPLGRLLVTDVGYFPRAAAHRMVRPSGSAELVVIICTNGRGRCTLDGSDFDLTAGQVAVLPPGRPHGYASSEDDPWTIWWLHVAGADIDDLVAGLAGERRIDVADPYRAVAAVERVLDALETDETLPSLVTASGSAWALIAQVIADARGRGARTGPVRAAQDHLRENLALPVRVPELAARAGLSAQHFAALFRAATGGGVISWVRSLRMARARELLTTSSTSVGEIARAVGYPDPLYFSRTFRRLHDVSPTEYRRQHAGR